MTESMLFFYHRNVSMQRLFKIILSFVIIVLFPHPPVVLLLGLNYPNHDVN